MSKSLSHVHERLNVGPDEIRRLAEIMRRIEFLANLTVAELNRISSYVQLYAYKSGETIFRAGQPADAFFLIDEGEIEISLRRKFFLLPGKRVAVLRSGNFFGETALIDRSPRTATARALTHCRLFVILVEDFNLVIHNNPAFAQLVKRVSRQRKFHSRFVAS